MIDAVRLACGGAIHPGYWRRHASRLWWIEAAAAAIAVAVAGVLIGFGLFVVAR